MAETHASSVKRWLAWSGDIDALKRLARLFESHWGKADHKEEPDAPAVVRVEEQKWNLQHVGTIDEVFAHEAIDLQRARRITFSAPERVTGSWYRRAPHNQAEVEFDHNGVRLRVFGPPTWVRAVATELGDEIQVHVPWWAWLRVRGVIATLSYALLFAVVAGLGSRLSQVSEKIADFPGGALGYWPALFVAGAAVMWIVMLPIESGVRRIFPGFEVVTTTRPGRSAGAIAFLSAVAASLVAGLLLLLLG